MNLVQVEKEGVKMKELPRLFQVAKNKIKTGRTMFLSSKTTTEHCREESKTDATIKEYDRKHISVNAIAEYWLIVQDLVSYIAEEEKYATELLVNKMKDEKLKEVLMPEYDKKLKFNEETGWFDFVDLTKHDKKVIANNTNKEYLK